MCGRYVRRAAKKAIADWFGVDPEHLPEFGPILRNIARRRFNLWCGFRQSRAKGRLFRCGGNSPFWARDARDGVKRINALAESIVTTATFVRLY
jgi:hypothetical protein